ncbi:MAG TPA: FecR family protein, partial [Terracidiphilus sp.]
MKHSSNTPLKTCLVALAAVACFAIFTVAAVAQDDDPPSQAGRLAIVNGNVSIQPAGSQDWGQAYLNYPLGPGDRIYTDADGRAEIQVGRTYVRVGPNSDVTFIDFNSQAVTFGAAQGALHVRTRGLWEGQSLYVQTPSGTSTVTGPADFRVDLYPDQQTAIFTNYQGDLYLSGANDFGMDTQPGQALELVGTNPVYPQWLQPAGPDDLDNWSERRDAQIARATSYQYVSPDAPGAEDLDAYGQWSPGTEYGDMWFPNVQAGWEPYHNGRWVDHQPWGWVWVEDEPWGYAPFHYGRWASYHGRWGWIPGPRQDHAVWSPALVAFAGGDSFGGGGMSIWFPLGPGEPYRPWYPCTPQYVDRVNISNIRETNVVHVQKTYVNVVNVTNVTNITYVNRTAATAVRQQDFASGRPVAQSAVRVDPQMMARARVIAKPEVAPTRGAIINRPPTRPVPVAVTRPTLINARGMAVAAQPKARPAPPPQKAAPAPPRIPNRVAIAPPPNVKMTPTARQAMQTAPHAAEAPARS